MDAESVYKQAALREEDPEDEIGFSQRKGKPTKLLRHASGKKKKSLSLQGPWTRRVRKEQRSGSPSVTSGFWGRGKGWALGVTASPSRDLGDLGRMGGGTSILGRCDGCRGTSVCHQRHPKSRPRAAVRHWGRPASGRGLARLPSR